jgi:uncharacterized protein YjiS (DUF1127 family)
MTALVTADAKASLGANPSQTEKAKSATGWLGRLAGRFAKARARRRLHAELSGMSDAMLLDIGVAEDEIYTIRQGSAITPRAWLARNPATRHLIG